MVLAVAPESASAIAGVKERDWLLSLNGRTLDDGDDQTFLETVTDSVEPILLSLSRDGRIKLVAISPSSEANQDDGEIADVEVEPESGGE